MKKVVFLTFLLISSLVLADVGDQRIISRRREIFQNTDCLENNTCNLETVRYLKEDYEVQLKESPHYGSRVVAQYTTSFVQDLEEYAFVQAIRGCVFNTEIINNKRETSFDFCRLNDEGSKCETFLYPNFRIESYLEDDPAYNSIFGYSRSHFYRWLERGEDFFDYNTHVYFGEQKPQKPELFIVDHPGTAFTQNDKAKNLALEFRTCLYKTDEVPRSLDPSQTDFAEPVSCFRWESVWVYNHNSDIYEQPQINPTIREFCQVP